MTHTPEGISEAIRDYILAEFLPGEDPSALQESVRLISDGILDSIAAVKLVVYLENRFNIKIEQNEVNVNNLDTIDSTMRLVVSKLNE